MGTFVGHDRRFLSPAPGARTEARSLVRQQHPPIVGSNVEAASNGAIPDDGTGPHRAWHAVWTRGRHEPGVCEELAAKSIDAFLPTITRVSRWSDRSKLIAWPLFPGYCFARFEPVLLSKVLRCNGVVSVLSNGGRPTPIPNFEIEALQRLVAAGLSYDPWPQLVTGSKVRVIAGPLVGVVGRLIRKGPEQLFVLAVELLRSGVRVQVSASDVQPF